MILVKLIGGLGNQMFQYATGRRLAHVLGVELKLDISWFETQDERTYSLGFFNIREDFATPKEISVLRAPKQGIVEHILSRVLSKPPESASTNIVEKYFHFDPDILYLPDGVCLDGYWQSEKYFADIAGIIRGEFTVKTPQVDKDMELSKQMALCSSVSLHIRRGDFVSNDHTNQVHGTCDMDYYFRSVESLTKIVKEPHFFIFSDESKWAADNMKLPYQTTFVTHNGKDKDYEDLRLMSQCKHHIIANSSFSWWGAWLSPNPDKIVFAPEKWFNASDMDTKDLIPDGWIKV